MGDARDQGADARLAAGDVEPPSTRAMRTRARAAPINSATVSRTSSSELEKSARLAAVDADPAGLAPVAGDGMIAPLRIPAPDRVPGPLPETSTASFSGPPFEDRRGVGEHQPRRGRPRRGERPGPTTEAGLEPISPARALSASSPT